MSTQAARQSPVESKDYPPEKRHKNDSSSTIGELSDSEGEASESAAASLQGESATAERADKLMKHQASHKFEPKDVNPEHFRTADTYFAHLCLHNAGTFCVGQAAIEPIWTATRDDKIVDVYKGMIRRNISSVPVLLRESGRWYGILDLMDICRYIITHFGTTKFKEETSFWDLVAQEGEFAKKTVTEVMKNPNTTRNPFHQVLASYSAFAVVEALARDPNIHRVPIIDNMQDKKLVNLVTESQCVKEVARISATLGDKAKKPLSAIPKLFHPVHSVTEETVALDAFNLMVMKNVQGLAVVDESTGRLRGNISLRDLKVIGGDVSLFWRLHQTVKNFIIKVRHEFQIKHNRPRRVVYATPQATIQNVVDLMNKHEIHRVFIVNNHQEKIPVGVVAIKDILLEGILP